MDIAGTRTARSFRVNAIALTLVCLTRGTLIVVLMLASVVAAVASEMSYRLAGIIGDGSERSIAVIELPDGRQRLVRAGDVLGDGTILEITSTAVRIKAGNEELLLRMRGNPRLAAATPRVETPQAGAAGAEGEDKGDVLDVEGGEAEVHNQQISASDVARMLEAALHAGPASGESPSAETISRQLNALLEIPEGATITEVDGVRVDTPQAAVAALQSSLARASAARLTVTGAGAMTTVLLAVDSEQ